MKTCPACQVSYPNNYAICPADGTPLEEVGAWAIGSTVRGKYRLLNKVGQGGMGSVYKALHLAFDELRALKVIAAELLSDDLFVKRFKNEAVITRRLQHPNAVRVDDIDEAEDGRPFIVMEFIEGKSLKKLIREEGPLPVGRVLAMIKQAAAALEAANRLGMVHRDIKPDNIALVDTPDGEMVKVLDFGIAKMKEARMGDNANLTLTGAGVVIGTPQYMSPEQAMGKRGDELDGRADLYSLGVVMYQMLTADLPFKADTTMEMLLAHMQKPPTPIGASHPELQVPENVAALTLRLLEKDRDRRPATARVLIQEIERLQKELENPQGTVYVPMPARPPQPLPRAADQQFPAPRPPQPPPRAPQPPPPAPRQPQPQPPPPAVHPRAPESRWGQWTALIVLLIGVMGLGLWFATRKPKPAPYVQLTADPVSITKGQPVTLHWTSQNATDLDLQPDVGKVDTEGSKMVTPQATTTYTLNGSGPGGMKSSYVEVTVTSISGGNVNPPPPGQVSASLRASPSSVEKGQSATLRWSSQNATSLELEPGVGRVPAQGSYGVYPQDTTTYTLTAMGADGKQVQQQVAVVVRAAAPPPPPPPNDKEVRGKITLGNMLYAKGMYDEAITAYQEGLALNPTNPQLREELNRQLNMVITACKKESSILVDEHLKCGPN